MAAMAKERTEQLGALSVPQLRTAISLYEFTNHSQLHPSHTIPLITLLANDSPKSLLDLISTPEGKPATPSTTNIIVVPQALLDETSQKQALFPSVQLLSSYCAAAAAALVYKNDPTYDITSIDGKFKVSNAMANATFEILTKGLSGFYSPTNILSYAKTIDNSELTFHAQLLSTLFQAFAFPEKVMTELDTILTSVNNDLLSFSTVSKTETENLCHMINITTCEKDPTFDVWVAKSNFILLNIEMASLYSVWKSGKGTTASSQSYSFKFSYLITQSTMNSSLVENNTVKITEYLNNMLSDQLDAVAKSVSPRAIISP